MSALRCIVCLDELAAQQTAPCGHSACAACWRQWVTTEKRKGVAAPLCFLRCQPPLPPLADLRLNGALQDAVAAHRAVIASPVVRCALAVEAGVLFVVAWLCAGLARAGSAVAVPMVAAARTAAQLKATVLAWAATVAATAASLSAACVRARQLIVGWAVGCRCRCPWSGARAAQRVPPQVALRAAPRMPRRVPPQRPGAGPARPASVRNIASLLCSVFACAAIMAIFAMDLFVPPQAPAQPPAADSLTTISSIRHSVRRCSARPASCSPECTLLVSFWLPSSSRRR